MSDEGKLERLGATDAAMLGGGIRHLVIGLCRLAPRADGTVPTYEEVRDLVAERLGRSPRFRQFPYLPEGASGFPVWTDTQEFDLDYHVVEAQTDGPVDRHGLDVLLTEWMTTPIEEDRPLWRVQYVPTDDGAALMVKSSHALADGLGSIALFAMLLFDVTEEPQREEAAPWEPRPLPTIEEVKNASGPDEGDEGDTDTAAGGGLFGRAAAVLSSPADIRETAGTAAEVGSYLFKKSRQQIPASPLAVGSGSPLELHTLEYPLERLKLLGRGLGTGATMNDVILGLVSGGLRQWLVENGHPLDDLLVRVPVNLKKDRKEGEGGNPGVAPMVVPLPMGIEDPVRRVRVLRERTEAIKAAGEPEHIMAVRKVAREAPAPLKERAMSLVTGRGQANVVIHNLPGPPIELYVLGAPTTSFHSFSLPSAGLALHLNAVSVGGVVSIGLAADQSVFKSLDAFVRGFEATEKALAGGVSRLDLVRRVPIFAPLDEDVQEDLASRMEERSVEVGETLVTQGESGDEFFLIVEGQFETKVDGEVVRSMGPGESFGEIAMLRDTERTATVVAETGGTVMVLGRDSFLEGVAADPASMVVAEAIINTRLGDLGRYQVFSETAD